MILYLDTSSLVKVYVEEEGSPAVREQVDRAEVVATSVVAYAETRAALARQRREGGLTAAAFDRARADFEEDWPSYVTLEVSEAVYREAGDLAEKHHLRALDSLHLASYMLLFGDGTKQIRFSSFDERLNRAARKEAKGTAG